MLQPIDGSAPYVSDPAECAVRTTPASTFKIPHSLIALETGAVSSALQVLPWDGTKQPFPAWERDHSLDSAVKSSVLWFFRRTAALIGRNRMLEFLEKFGYTDDTFERELTSFWLNGDLVVSPREQLEFMGRLARYELPVARQHVDAVKTALLMPSGALTNASGTHDFALTWPGPLVVRAKAGNATVGGERVSWLVGLVEARGRQYVFVARVRGQGQLPGTAGADLARRVLNVLGPNADKQPFDRPQPPTSATAVLAGHSQTAHPAGVGGERPDIECVTFTTPERLPSGQSFRSEIGRGLEVRLTADGAGQWHIGVGPADTTDDFLWVVSPPFQTAPHLRIGAGYNLTALQSAQLSPRQFRFVTSQLEYEDAAAFVERARRDDGGTITVADIERKGKGSLELWITGFGSSGDRDALTWISARGRACQPR